MPRLVYCLDDFFKHEKKDCYFIVFGRTFPIELDDNFVVSENPSGRKELLDWFELNYPGVDIKPIWPHHSASFGLFLQMEYDGSLVIDFDKESLEAFCDFWEDENKNGVSKDGTFTCYLIEYDSYLKDPR